MNQKIKLLLVDDHKIIRDGIKSILKPSKKIIVVQEAEDGEEAINNYDKQKCNIIIMDINMPRTDGIEATKEIIGMDPHAKILALSMYNHESYIKDILKAGAMGYVLKDTGEQELLKAIYTVSAGNYYFGAGIFGSMMHEFSHGPNQTKKETKLTERQEEVLALLADGKTNKEIGKQLKLSTRTIDSHRRNMLKKTNSKNTADLLRYAFKKGL